MDSILKVSVFVLMFLIWTGGSSWAGYKFEIGDTTKGEISFWTQAWYQYAENASDSNVSVY